MDIIRNGKTITLTESEIEQAYRTKLREKRLREAKNQLLEHVGIDTSFGSDLKNNEINRQAFLACYGFSAEDAINSESPNYLLEAIVEVFEDKLDWNKPEGEQFQNACFRVLSEIAVKEEVFTQEDAKSDVIKYITGQSDHFFAERGTTRRAVLENEELISKIAAEHYHCVTRFGNDRYWSCMDACTVEPGIICSFPKALTEEQSNVLLILLEKAGLHHIYDVVQTGTEEDANDYISNAKSFGSDAVLSLEEGIERIAKEIAKPFSEYGLSEKETKAIQNLMAIFGVIPTFAEDAD